MTTSVVKVAMTPVAIAADVVVIAVSTATTGKPEAGVTKALLESAADDVKEAMDEIT